MWIQLEFVWQSQMTEYIIGLEVWINAGGVFEENRAGVLPAGGEPAGSDLRALHGE